MKISNLFHLFLLPVLLSSAGCSVFCDAHTQKESFMLTEQFSSQGPIFIDDKLDSASGTGDALMWHLEAGSYYFYLKDYQRSLAELDKAEEIIEDFDRRAVVNVRGAGSESVALLTNANALPYEPYGRDRVMIPVLKAFNYLALEDQDGFFVELSRLREVQDKASAAMVTALENEQYEVEQTENSSEAMEALNKNVRCQQRIQAMAELGGEAYEGLVNPMALFLSALGCILEGDYNNARIDFERLHVMMPQNELFAALFVECSRRVGVQCSVDSEGVDFDPDQPFAVILLANGRGMALEEERIDLVLPYLGYTGMALPFGVTYPREGQMLSAASGNVSKNSQVIANLDAIMAGECAGRMPLRMTRLVASYITKELVSLAITQAVANNGNAEAEALAYLVTGIYKYATNVADTRCWELLPGEYQLIMLPLAADGKLRLQGAYQGEVEASPDCRCILVYVDARAAGQVTLHSWEIQ